MSQIGIRLADGSFFPIFEDDSPQRKKLTLSPARDGQSSAQIDFERRSGDDKQYVGCLVLEDLSETGSKELELILGLDEDGNIDARVSDAAGEQYQSFSVNLSTLETAESFSLPDESDDDSGVELGGVDSLRELGMSDIEQTEDDPASLELQDSFASPDGPTDSTGSPAVSEDLAMPDIALPAAEHPEEYQHEGYRTESEGDAVESRPFHIVSLIAVLLIGLSLVALGAFAVFRLLQTEALPELRAAVAVAPMVTARRRLRAGSNRVS